MDVRPVFSTYFIQDLSLNLSRWAKVWAKPGNGGGRWLRLSQRGGETIWTHAVRTDSRWRRTLVGVLCPAVGQSKLEQKSRY